MKHIVYTWKEFDRDINKLIKKFKDANFKPNSIVCIAVGGLTLGAKLRNKLEKPLTIISATSYKKRKRGTLFLNATYTVPLRSPILLVDDVADSGSTLQMVKDHLSLGGSVVKTATIFYKEQSKIKPDWYIRKTEGWINFPWER